MPEILLLNNGDSLEGNAILSGGNLFIYIYGKTLKEAFELLIEPENTAKIDYKQMTGAVAVYEGYTRLTAVRDEGNGLVTAILTREG